MKRLVALFALILAVLPISLALADDAPPSEPQPSIYYSLGDFHLTVPFSQVNVVYLYDFVGKRNLLGGETPLAAFRNLYATVGAVTSVDGRGTPFIGGHFFLPNPLPNLAALNALHPGLFGGYDINRKAAIGGFKVSAMIF